MTKQPSEQFFKDLAATLRRHGPEPFVSLANALRDPDTREHAIKTLEGLAAVASKADLTSKTIRTPKSEAPSNDSQRARALVQQVLQADPRRGELLASLHDQLSSRKVPPTKGEIVALLYELSIETSPNAPRNRLVYVLLRHLSQQPWVDLVK